MIEKMTKRCLKAHHDSKLNLINFRKMMDNATQLYVYHKRWTMTTNKFKDEIDSIESQLIELAQSFNFYKDTNDAMRYKAQNIHSQLSLRQKKREEYVQLFCGLKDAMELRLSTFLRLLVVERVEQSVVNINILDVIVNLCIDCECQKKYLFSTIRSWNSSFVGLKKKYKDIWLESV